MVTLLKRSWGIAFSKALSIALKRVGLPKGDPSTNEDYWKLIQTFKSKTKPTFEGR
jgi:hypothetical protein